MAKRVWYKGRVSHIDPTDNEYVVQVVLDVFNFNGLEITPFDDRIIMAQSMLTSDNVDVGDTIEVTVEVFKYA